LTKWGEAWGVPDRWGWFGPSPDNLHEPQTFPTSSLPQYLETNRYNETLSQCLLGTSGSHL
jgi:hypothetical protein